MIEWRILYPFGSNLHNIYDLIPNDNSIFIIWFIISHPFSCIEFVSFFIQNGSTFLWYRRVLCLFMLCTILTLSIECVAVHWFEHLMYFQTFPLYLYHTIFCDFCDSLNDNYTGYGLDEKEKVDTVLPLLYQWSRCESSTMWCCAVNRYVTKWLDHCYPVQSFLLFLFSEHIWMTLHNVCCQSDRWVEFYSYVLRCGVLCCVPSTECGMECLLNVLFCL